MTDRTRHLNLNYPMFMDQIEPHGRLTMDRKSHACWYYYVLAIKNMIRVGRGPQDQIIEFDTDASFAETPTWMDKEYDQIARSVAMLYALDSPDDFLPFFPLIEQESLRVFGFDVPAEVVSPFGVKRGRLN